MKHETVIDINEVESEVAIDVNENYKHAYYIKKAII